MSFNEGDFIKIDYSMFRVSDNSLVRTTDKALAEKNGIYNKDVKYRPQLIVLGKDMSLKGVSNAIKAMNIGEKKKIELEPKDAFGEKDRSLVRIMPLADFKKRDIAPQPGMQIDVDGVIATIKSVNSGRVMVDANHPLAGERLVYEIKVVEKVEKEEEKVKALCELYDLSPEKVEIMEKKVHLRFGPETKKDAYYARNKLDVADALLEYMPSFEKMVVEEEYTKASNEAKETEDAA